MQTPASPRGRLALACAVAATLSSAGAWAAQDYPNQPIRLIVPFAPGGGTDMIARVVGKKLGERLGQPVIVDNRPGASGIIGAEAVARSAPDGYTLLMATTAISSNGSLYNTISYDLKKDFAPVSQLANAPAVLVVNPGLPVSSLQELIRYARERPGQVNYASYGVGTAPHLVAELFQQSSGTKLYHVPYKGGGPAVLATLSGETRLLFPSLVPVMNHIRNGKLRALAVASDKRSPSLPEVPTFREAGMEFETGTWFGIVARGGTPAPIVARLHQEIVALLNDADVRKSISDEGAEVVPSPTPEAFGKLIQAEVERWAKVVRTAGIKIEK
ncbi:tripartite tricarboxylate transporter substrate binding protein [Pigmentiphaga sp. H8]|uniref:Bug family tripartite tricarboxylate transporter substrate binding protein n=1 Tax=Pigmentiphaga sp. H8 TaxID=2488560 RepID=UPI000F5AE3B5|nr:tripartite tricarboxylate transporter substrate binding protein [Pigmentiphaga sp. H8]AZG10387.1 tripartite tricarboxylate transporter substrate binding protein [Pigmentiphaga sp. H8]